MIMSNLCWLLLAISLTTGSPTSPPTKGLDLRWIFDLVKQTSRSLIGVLQKPTPPPPTEPPWDRPGGQPATVQTQSVVEGLSEAILNRLPSKYSYQPKILAHSYIDESTWTSLIRLTIDNIFYHIRVQYQPANYAIKLKKLKGPLDADEPLSSFNDEVTIQNPGSNQVVQPVNEPEVETPPPFQPPTEVWVESPPTTPSTDPAIPSERSKVTTLSPATTPPMTTPIPSTTEISKSRKEMSEKPTPKNNVAWLGQEMAIQVAIGEEVRENQPTIYVREQVGILQEEIIVMICSVLKWQVCPYKNSTINILGFGTRVNNANGLNYVVRATLDNTPYHISLTQLPGATDLELTGVRVKVTDKTLLETFAPVMKRKTIAFSINK